MSMTDPIADLLTRIRNATLARLDTVTCPSSKLKVRILEILRSEGYIKSYRVALAGKFEEISIQLRYLEDRQPVILGIRRISRPGLRQYVRHDKIPLIRQGMGTTILSTSQGLMTDREARVKHVGGELICTIW